jgi:DNA polymerase III epsilon subunit-like protein
MSALNYDDGLITITRVLKNGKTKVEHIRIEDLERFEYRRPGIMTGALTFITKDGRRTQGIEVHRKFGAIFDELIEALQSDLAAKQTDSRSNVSKTAWKKPTKRQSQSSLVQQRTVEVAFDGRKQTNQLEFIGAEEGFSNRVPRIVLDHPEFAVIDFETTGLQPADGDRVIQVAVVIVDAAGNILDDWSSYVNPGRDTGAVHIHGITGEQVRSAPNFKEIWPAMASLLNGRIIVAHNASFEVKFLLAELDYFNESVEPAKFAWFDTMSLAGSDFPGIPDKRQETIASYLGIDRSSLPGGRDHNALTDTHVAAKILGHYLTNGLPRVLDAVTWPLVTNLQAPRIVSIDTAEAIEKEEEALSTLLASVIEGPSEQIAIPRGAEIYFTQFYSETHVYSHALSRLGAIEARSVTKSRCKLVVTGDRQYVSGAMKKALNFNIPIVHIDYIDLVVTEDD